MTIDIKLPQPFTDSSLPVMPHGVGVIPDSGETPYRWLAESLGGESGSAVAAWPEQGGAGTLTGGGATLQNVAGYRAVTFDGSNALSIPAGAPLPSSRGSICGVARLSPTALGDSQYGLVALATSVDASNGRIFRGASGAMRFQRIGTTPTAVSSTGTVPPGGFFTFGFSQRASGAVAMLNGEIINDGAGDLAGFARFFIGTMGTSTRWLGDVFEIAAWNEWLDAAQFAQFHAAMQDHYSFIS